MQYAPPQAAFPADAFKIREPSPPYLVFDEFVDVVLGPVVAGGHLEDVGGAEQRLAAVPVGYALKW